jgi:predicted GH43/DUF377 family glycosyl hydrolase
MNRRNFLTGAGAFALSGGAASGQQLQLDAGSRIGLELVKTPDGSRQLRLLMNCSGDCRLAGEFISAVVPMPAATRIRWVPQWVTPQRYQKWPKNPIYGPQQSGEWDNWTNGVGIVRSADGTKYHMYYADQKNGIGFATASIAEPTVWREHPASPVIRPKPEPHWEGGRLNQPRMAKVTDTHWRMYYTGWGQDLWRMGLAESFDGGITWRRYSDDPLIPLGAPGSRDSAAVCVPMVLRHGGKWHMWYTGSRKREEGIHTFYATSPDGLRWDKYEGNPVLPTIPNSTWETSVVSRPYVRVEHGIFKMWYSMRGKTYRIGYDESGDGIHWERSPQNPILQVSPSGWDSDMVEYPEIDVVDGVYRMWYCGNGFGTVGYSEGVPETSLEVQTRSGPSPEPGGGWSEWSANYSAPDGQSCLSPANRYIQARVLFRTSKPNLSPSLRSLEIVG